LVAVACALVNAYLALAFLASRDLAMLISSRDYRIQVRSAHVYAWLMVHC